MADQLFEGPEVPLPAGVSRNHIVMHLDQEPSPPLRFASGYESFVGFVLEVGSDPELLRDNLDQLVAFIQRHPEVVSDNTLLTAAGIFLGNSVTQHYPRAAWMVPEGEPEVGPEDEGGFPVRTAVRELVVHPEWTQRYLSTLDRRLTEPSRHHDARRVRVTPA